MKGMMLAVIFAVMVSAGCAAPEQNAKQRYDAVQSMGWDPVTTSAVYARKLLIGMTGEQVTMAWGKPYRINSTVTAGVVHEQWVYIVSRYSPRRYAYFENGKLVAWQN